MPIRGVNGLPGAGKTLFIVRELYLMRKREARAGRGFTPIVSNTPLWFPWGPKPFLVSSMDVVYQLRKCAVFLDEIHLLIDTSKRGGRDDQFKPWVSQLRKAEVDLWWTSQAWDSVDIELRRRTAYSYFLENRLNFGHFYAPFYYGIKPEKSKLAGKRWFLFNPFIAACYQTDYEIERKKAA